MLNELERRFSNRLSDSLEHALGAKIATLVYSILKTDYGIEKDEVPANPGALKKVLNKIFGPTGLDSLEMLIAKEILTEFDLPDNLGVEDLSLVEALRKARKKLSVK